MYFLEIICADIVFKFSRHQGRSQGGTTGANAPAWLNGTTRTSYSLMLGRRSEFFLGCVLGLLQPTELF